MDPRAARVAQLLRAYRASGLAKRPRRRIPAPVQPRAIEREYAAAILGVVAALRAALAVELLPMVPDLLAAAARERQDDYESERVRRMIEAARRRLEGSLGTAALEELVRRYVDRVDRHNRIQLGRQLVAAMGVDPLSSVPGLRPVIDGFVAENVALIRDVPTKALGEIERATMRAVQRGTPHRDLAKEIEGRLGIAEDRARLIARDQVLSANAAITTTRHRALGVTSFVWRSVNDERVRDAHRSLDGQTFRYDDPPSEGLPGEPIMCRCYAEPSLDDILDGA